jgi:signal transduction histidine kinase
MLFANKLKYNKYTGYRLCIAAFVIIFITLVNCNNYNKGTPLKNTSYNLRLDTANNLFDSGKPTRAIFYLDSVTPCYNNLTFQQKFEDYRIHYLYYFNTKRNNVYAMRYANLILKLAASTKNTEEYVTAYSMGRFYMGDALFSEGRFNEAYFNYYQGKQVSSKSKELQSCMLSEYSYHMGMILYKQEHYREAAIYFKTSFNETGTCSATFVNYYRRQELLDNIGLSYNKVNELDSALKYFNKALVYINHPPRKKNFDTDSLLNAARGVVYGNQASVYVKQKRYNQAKTLLKKSITVNIKRGFDNNDAILAELKLAQLYESQNQVDSMLPVLQTIQQQLKTFKNDEAQANWNRLTATYYEHKGELPKALMHLKRYYTLLTLLNNKVVELKSTDITGQLKQFEKEHEVSQLKKTNRNKNLYLIIATAFFIMTLVIMALIYLNWQKSKKLLNALSSMNNQVQQKNQELQLALEKVEVSSQEKDRILRTVAHDLRNPIGGIASLTGSVMDDGECSSEQTNYLSLIKDTAYNSLELINEILEATNSNTDTLNKQLVEINGLLKNSVDLLRFKASEKNQDIILDMPDTPEQLLISREKIWRVVSNLISNAIKFSPVGSAIQVNLLRIASGVQISVNDRGIGIPDKLKDKVFNMFTEAKRPGTLGEKSFGLGLSICKHIVDLHQGKIWFECDDQTGTTFYVTLTSDCN